MTVTLSNNQILTASERRRLGKEMLGYGRVKYVVDQIKASGYNIHRSTLYAAKNGSPLEPLSIEKIRAFLASISNQ